MTVAALDYGKRYLGVALKNDTSAQALRYHTVDQQQIDALAWLREFVVREAVQTLVVGEPLGDDGQVTQQTEVSRDFAARLTREISDVTIILWGEALTSVAAHKILQREGAPAAEVHAEAARLILSDYLEQQQE